MHSVTGLAALEAQVRRDIALTAHPRADWMKENFFGGKPMLDVLIVGAGQSGLATAFQLIRERVRNILVIDRAPQGKEGPWVTFARMPTLRSPKDQTGPDLDIPSLTFQAWFEAQRGGVIGNRPGVIAELPVGIAALEERGGGFGQLRPWSRRRVSLQELDARFGRFRRQIEPQALEQMGFVHPQRRFYHPVLSVVSVLGQCREV